MCLSALKYYLKRTQSCRPSCNRLFVSAFSHKQRAVAKNTVSFWIRSVIRGAYENVPEEDRRLLKIKPHEVRAMASSLVFKKTCALSQVMDAGSWRCHTTFASHYLRDYTHKFMDISSLGPVVAGQQLVPAEEVRPQTSQH